MTEEDLVKDIVRMIASPASGLRDCAKDIIAKVRAFDQVEIEAIKERLDLLEKRLHDLSHHRGLIREVR